MMIHLPIHRWTVMPGVFGAMYQARKTLSDLVALIRRLQLRMGIGRPSMRWLSYSADYLFANLPSFGFTDVELWFFCPLRNNRDTHPVALARKGQSLTSGLSR